VTPTPHRKHPPTASQRARRTPDLTGGLVATVLLAAACTTLHPPPEQHPPSTPTSANQLPSTQEQDALAEQPMPSLPLSAAVPMPLSTRTPRAIALPAPTRAGPTGVPTGFPHTPDGALAQLAEIDKAAMQSANLTAAATVITAWAAPGGPTPRTWTRIRALDGLLAVATSLSTGPPLTLRVMPAMGLIKGTLGPDFAVVCIDFEIDATRTETQRTADADCQRMTWQHDRWIIGQGAEPYPAPAVWPGTDTAIDIGYLDLQGTSQWSLKAGISATSTPANPPAAFEPARPGAAPLISAVPALAAGGS
jgi:hypothetical protein